jgi:transcription elongation factor Elf1
MTTKRQVPGLNCPQCGKFIETTISELLTATGLVCSHCRLQLTINKQESKRAMEIFEDVNKASKNLEKASKFNR